MLPIFIDLLAGGLFALGLLIFMCAQASLIITAFLTSIGWGIAYFLIPIAALLYTALYWDEVKKPFFFSLFGLALFATGLVLSFKSPDKAYVQTYENFFYNEENLSPWKRCLSFGMDWFKITSGLMSESKDFLTGDSTAIKNSFKLKKIDFGDSFPMAAQPKTLLEAVQSGNLHKVRSFLAQGESPNTKTQMGTSVLMEAIAYGYIKIAELLIQRGADIHYADPNGDTPLTVAQKSLRPNMVALIEKHLSEPTEPQTS